MGIVKSRNDLAMMSSKRFNDIRIVEITNIFIQKTTLWRLMMLKMMEHRGIDNRILWTQIVDMLVPKRFLQD